MFCVLIGEIAAFVNNRFILDIIIEDEYRIFDIRVSVETSGSIIFSLRFNHGGWRFYVPTFNTRLYFNTILLVRDQPTDFVLAIALSKSWTKNISSPNLSWYSILILCRKLCSWSIWVLPFQSSLMTFHENEENWSFVWVILLNVLSEISLEEECFIAFWKFSIIIVILYSLQKLSLYHFSYDVGFIFTKSVEISIWR